MSIFNNKLPNSLEDVKKAAIGSSSSGSEIGNWGNSTSSLYLTLTSNVNSANISMNSNTGNMFNFTAPNFAAAIAAGENIFVPSQSLYMDNFDSFSDNDDDEQHDDEYHDDEQLDYYQPSSSNYQINNFTQPKGSLFSSNQSHIFGYSNFLGQYSSNVKPYNNIFAKKQPCFSNQSLMISKKSQIFSNQPTTKNLFEQKPNIFAPKTNNEQNINNVFVKQSQGVTITQNKLKQKNSDKFNQTCVKKKEEQIKKYSSESQNSQKSQDEQKNSFQSQSQSSNSNSSKSKSSNPKSNHNDSSNWQDDTNYLINLGLNKIQPHKNKLIVTQIQQCQNIFKNNNNQSTNKSLSNIFTNNNSQKQQTKPLLNIFEKQPNQLIQSKISKKSFENTFKNVIQKKPNQNEKNLINLQQQPTSITSHEIQFTSNIQKQEKEKNVPSIQSSQTVRIQKLQKDNKKQEQVTALKERVKQLEKLNKQYLLIIDNLSLTVKNLSVVQTITINKPQEKKEVEKNTYLESKKPKDWYLENKSKKWTLFDDQD